MRKLARVLTLGCLAGSLISLPALAQNILVIMNTAIAPYQQVLQALRKAGPFEIQVLDLKDVGQAVYSGKTGVVVFGTEAMSALKNMPSSLPVVYTMALEPCSLPGRRVSGVIMQISVEDEIARIPKILPKAKKVGVLYNPAYSSKTVSRARETVGDYGLSLEPIAVESQNDIGDALTKLGKLRIDVLLLLVDKTALQPAAIEQMIRFSGENQVPFIGLTIFHVKAGALAAFAIDYEDIGIQTAQLTKEMLAEPALDGKVEKPRKIITFINSDTQKRLNLGEIKDLTDVKYTQ
jgi:putative ABC transport system substrate-binding protein